VNSAGHPGTQKHVQLDFKMGIGVFYLRKSGVDLNGQVYAFFDGSGAGGFRMSCFLCNYAVYQNTGPKP